MGVVGGHRADSIYIYYALFGDFAFANPITQAYLKILFTEVNPPDHVACHGYGAFPVPVDSIPYVVLLYSQFEPFHTTVTSP